MKVEPQGAAGRHIRAHVQVGDQLEVGAPRGLFTLDEGDRPVALISAGIGATPLLAMLHELHENGSTREVWWFHGARTRAEHAFAGEAQSLVDELAHARHRIWYSRPGPTDRVGVDYDENGRITAEALHAAGVPLDGEFYMCGPVPFMNALREGLAALGVLRGTCTRRSSARRVRSHRESSLLPSGRHINPKARRARDRSSRSYEPR